jgi:ABC-type Mn2+/Zn2+ transport system ATPase subunit
VVVGENGQGKSLLARTLAGAIAVKGRAAITSDQQNSGFVCLLFQDVLVQTMLRSFTMLAFGGLGLDKAAILRIYKNMCRDFKAAWHDMDGEANLHINDWDADQHLLLDIKTILVATRLASAPAALILDEPDWGMSRRSAIAFVSAVLAVAHGQNTPVVLISHKPWWQSIARSKLLVSRSVRSGNVDHVEPAFSITVSAEEVSD